MMLLRSSPSDAPSVTPIALAAVVVHVEALADSASAVSAQQQQPESALVVGLDEPTPQPQDIAVAATSSSSSSSSFTAATADPSGISSTSSLDSPPATAPTQQQQPAIATAGRRRRTPMVPLAVVLERGQPAGERPLVPPLDLASLSDSLLGDAAVGQVFTSLFQLLPGPGEPQRALLYAPQVAVPAGTPPPSSLPLLVYLPGIDGTGLAAYRQFPRLACRFELRALLMPPQERTPFEQLVEEVARQIEEEVSGMDPSRPVYLLGESFGGLLALALAPRLKCVDRLILVNPATSFTRSPWPVVGRALPSLPPDLYKLLPIALSPLLSNPISMARRGASPGDPPLKQASDVLYGLLELLPELSSLRFVLPPDTLSWRLSLLQQGAQAVAPDLGKVRQRTLLLAGQLDLVIPSAQEAPRLEREMPRCRARVLAGRSHALLQESDLDLVALLDEEDFYVRTRRLSRPLASSSYASLSSWDPAPQAQAQAQARAAGTATTSSTSSADGFTSDDGSETATGAWKPAAAPPPGGANFGTAEAVELPTPGELARARDGGGLAILRRLVSPVYLSTDASSGRVQQGLGGLPAPSCGPLLFVGNHQLFAPDMPLMVAHFLEERGELLRGLAHPMALGVAPGGRPVRNAGGNAAFGRFLETFGAVPVSGRNLYALLEAGESVLLYPGGVREALKNKNERYALFWPQRPEFVRMACRFGATIVPFAAIGAEEGVTQILDSRELRAAPFIGDLLRRQEGSIVKARRGVTEAANIDESFVAPLVSFNPPSRFYFLFGAPIATDPRLASDRAAVDQLYARVRSEVKGGLGYLLRKREQDPYKDLLPRLLHEAATGKQAPTFRL